jgi:hypothetical protein
MYRVNRLATVDVQDLLTVGGTTGFSQQMAFVYGTGSVSFRATLNGGKETPPVVSNATGTGTFVLTSNGLQYDITVKNLSGSLITGAHFHMADTGLPGPVVMPITFTGTRATGTWTTLTAEQRTALLEGRIYVNVHTAAHPDGEIRGQVTVQ